MNTAEYQKQWHIKNRERQLAWMRDYYQRTKLIRKRTRLECRSFVLKRLGLTNADYDKIVEVQKGLCSICLQKPKTVLYIDHDHKTRLFRGLLCQKCNSAVGLFQDDVQILQRAIGYLNASYRQAP